MTISFDLPGEIEMSLRRTLGDIGQAAKEALLIELYRQEKLTRRQLSTALGLSRFETDAILKRHEVFYDMTAEDVARESEGLHKLRDGHADRR